MGALGSQDTKWSRGLIARLEDLNFRITGKKVLMMVGACGPLHGRNRSLRSRGNRLCQGQEIVGPRMVEVGAIGPWGGRNRSLYTLGWQE